MKHIARKAVVLSAAAVLTLGVDATAGNRDRNGQSGATELLVNPGGRSTGTFTNDVANTMGVEAMRVNIAGLAKTERLELGLSYQRYLSGAGISVTNGGLALDLKNAGVLGVNVMSMNFGDIPITEFNSPEGGIGSFTPQFFNITLGFAKEFSNSIHAGVSATFVNEQISNIRANGVGFDAGVMYTTGERDNFHFGITLRNVGTSMRFAGQGFSIDAEAPQSSLYVLSRNTPQDAFQLPTYLQLGLAYDFYLDEGRLESDTSVPRHRLTPMASFTSNSFLSDYLGAGLEYSYKNMFMVRGGYRHELDPGDVTTDASGAEVSSRSFYTGFAAGATVQAPLGRTGPMLALDYSYRPTSRPANGVHAISLRFNLR